MNKCLHCGADVSDKAKYCGDRCRMAYKRTRTKEPEQITPNKQLGYHVVSGEVYGRRAVVFPGLKESWTTWPEPEGKTDKPVNGNRCVFKRSDGTVYAIDACGAVFNLVNALRGLNRPDNYGTADCQCQMCQNNRNRPLEKRFIINHGQPKGLNELLKNEVNRVALPGDSDY